MTRLPPVTTALARLVGTGISSLLLAYMVARGPGRPDEDRASKPDAPPTTAAGKSGPSSKTIRRGVKAGKRFREPEPKRFPGRKKPRRPRVPRGWPLPPKAAFLWADKRLSGGASRVADVFLLLTDPLYRQHVKPLLDEVERKRSRRGRPLYTSEELEAIRILLLASGNPHYESRKNRGLRDLLTGDRYQIRDALGFGHPRNRPGKNTARLDGVPAGAQLTKHARRVNDRLRRIAYEQVLSGVIRRHLAMFPEELSEEARVLHMDGTAILISGRCPIYNDEDELVNPDRITCPDGGYLAKSAAVAKPGHGFVLVALTTSVSGLPLAYFIGRRNAPERTLGRIVLRLFARHIHPHLPHRRISILTTDSNFNHWLLRVLCRRLGIIENISLSSHKHRQAEEEESLSDDHKSGPDPNNADAEKGQRRKKRKRKKARPRTSADNRNDAEIEIEGYSNWYTNGHRELLCKCGEGTTIHRARMKENGHVSVATEGQCDNCGSITIRSGQWRRAQNPDRFVLCETKVPLSKRDWLFGNPLTYNDPVARLYGSGRFGHNEGFNSALGSRYSLTNHRHPYTNIDQVRTDVAIAFTLIHLQTMRQRMTTTATPNPSNAAVAPRGAVT